MTISHTSPVQAIPPTLATGFTNGATAYLNAEPWYAMDGSGFVTVSGIFTPGTHNTVQFTIPAAVTPGYRIATGCFQNGGNAVRIDLVPAGSVVNVWLIASYPTASATGIIWLDINYMAYGSGGV